MLRGSENDHESKTIDGVWFRKKKKKRSNIKRLENIKRYHKNVIKILKPHSEKVLCMLHFFFLPIGSPLGFP